MVRIRVADMDWFVGFAAAVLDLLIEVEGEQVLATDRMHALAAEIRRRSKGVYPPK